MLISFESSHSSNYLSFKVIIFICLIGHEIINYINYNIHNMLLGHKCFKLYRLSKPAFKYNLCSSSCL